MASMIWKCSERERRLLEELSRHYGLSVVEILNLAREHLLASIDPMPETDGEPYEWPTEFEPDLLWITPEVPKPDANIDLLLAWDQAQRDVVTCRMILNGNPMIKTLVSVHKNTTDWFRFWSERLPNPEARERYKVLAERGEAEMQRLEAIRRRRQMRVVPRPKEE